MPPSHETILQRLKSGDESALEEMFATWYPALCVYVLEFTRSRESAEDIVQDLFLDVWRLRNGIRIESSLNAYLYAAARNRALNHLRKTSREAEYAARAAHEVETTASGADSAEAGERAAAVREAFAALPPRAREVAELRWQHQLSYAEIAEIMGIGIKGVENQLGRVRKLLRDRLQRFMPE